MSGSANPLSEGDIAATNVLPAYETSLVFGATEAELERALGWRRAELNRPDATVSGASTARHLELMFRKPGYADFIVAAADAHDARSLGVVGLACKTMPSVGLALACHARFQRLTNRTATYETTLDDDGLHLHELRPDGSDGGLLLSDYTLLVAHRLLSLLAGVPVPLRGVTSRRATLPASERRAYERVFGVPVKEGGARAVLTLDPSFLALPVPRADPELEAYFRDLLERSLPVDPAVPALLTSLRAAIRDRLRLGAPSLDDVASDLHVSERTLQRRLRELHTGFQEQVDETRKALAAVHLRRPELSLAEVAWLLGFAEQASFFRAFRRWFSQTPDAYRRALR